MKQNKKIDPNNNIYLDKDYPQHTMDEMKIKLIKKYNISSEEAEKILNFLIINKKNNHAQIQKKNSNNIKKTQKQQTKQESSTDNILHQNKEHVELTQTAQKTDYTNNVDSIISDIIPDYNKDFSIEVEHVDLTFDIETDKIDNIKEMVIRTLKRDKSKKVRFKVLDDITFKIYQGEKVGIIGYNGAGKSTLLSVITGIYPPDKGTVKTNGTLSPLLSLGAGFDYNYSGRKNIYLNGAVLGYNKKILEEKIDEIIEFTELGDFIDVPIKNYSSGMLSKLAFAIATTLSPDILIIDEILGVGDATFHKKSTDRLRSLMDTGTTVLLVSHSIPQIREICDKAIWIDNGKIKEIGEVNKVCDHYLQDAEKASKEQIRNITFR